MNRSLFVIASPVRHRERSAAIHAAVARQHGLPRRYAPRSDDTGSWLVCSSEPELAARADG